MFLGKGNTSNLKKLLPFFVRQMNQLKTSKLLVEHQGFLFSNLLYHRFIGSLWHLCHNSYNFTTLKAHCFYHVLENLMCFDYSLTFYNTQTVDFSGQLTILTQKMKLWRAKILQRLLLWLWRLGNLWYFWLFIFCYL